MKEISVGELEKILAKVKNKRDKIKLIIIDSESSGIRMEGYLDFHVMPKKKDEILKLYAAGEAGVV